MSPSEEFCQGLVCGILIGFFILLLETELSRDRNNLQQEESVKQRGPEENDGKFSWEGEFKMKSILLGVERNRP